MSLRWDRATHLLRKGLRADYPDLELSQESLLEEEIPVTLRHEGLLDGILLDKATLRPALFEYQQELIDKISALPVTRALLALPTGAGKTRTVVTAVLDGVERGEYRRVAWLAPSLELIDQAYSALESLWRCHGGVPRLRIARTPDPDDSTPTVFLSTPQAIYSRRSDKRYTQGWDVIIFDEAHQLGAPTFRAAVSAMQAESVPKASPSGTLPTLLGLSATPGRVSPSETEDLVATFEGNLLVSELLAPNPIRSLQRWGVLAELEFRPLTKSVVPIDDEVRRLRIGATACIQLVARKRRPLVFAPSVPGAIVLAEVLRSKGIAAEALHSKTHHLRRRQVIEDFSTGKVEVLTNKSLLATGYDCPAISDVLILDRVNSPIQFEQIVGRAARGPETGGSNLATVWQFDDHLDLHGLPQSYYRFSDFDWK